MLIYLYDRSRDGLLTACREAVRRNEDPDLLLPPDEPAGLFDRVVAVAADAGAAAEMEELIAEKISPHSLRLLHDAFRSEADGIGTILWRYLRLGLRERCRVDSLLSHDDVLPVHRLARAVRMEAHRMKGFVRFREIAPELYYAAIDTRYAVLPLLEDHFRERFSDRCWIIHDVKRGRGLLYDLRRKRCVETELDFGAEPTETEREERFAALWRTFFREVAVAERENLRLQRSKVAHRYRKMLTEFVG